MTKVSLGMASMTAGGVYIALLPLCERIEIVGEIRLGKHEISVIEFLVIPKALEQLQKGLEERYGPMLSFSDFELEFKADESSVVVTVTTLENWVPAISALREAS